MHRGDIGVEACPYILQVEEQKIYILQHLRCRSSALAIETDHGELCLLVDLALHRLPRIDLPPQPMLWDEEADDLHSSREEGIDEVGARRSNERTLIDHQRYPLPFKEGE